MSPSATIHTFTGLAAGVGAGLAQLPGADAPVLVSLQASMILELAKQAAVPMSRIAAAEQALILGATMVGRGLSQSLVGWVPGLGNVVNAATAAAITEAVGWAAVAWFEE